MNQEFELIAKTFQGLEEVLAQELTELGASNIENRTTYGFFHRRQSHDV